jgi:ribonuclease HI
MAPTDAELLRHLAREEPLSATLAAFPGVGRERIAALLERLAGELEARERPAPPKAREAREPDASTERPPPAPPSSESAEASAGHTAVRVYSDGAARGNPGPAGAGAVLLDTQGRVVDRLGKYLGVQTNNYAEYMGLLLGLKRARALGAREVEVFADSELMIRQLGGQYAVKSPTLKPLFEQARALLGEFTRVKLVHGPRAMNTDADEMSNRAIDERL